MSKKKIWSTYGFKAFRAGEFGNGGHNIYVSSSGILQRIHQTDITRNGYVDLVFCNSQNHEEKVPVYLYRDPVNHPEQREELFIGGAWSGAVGDLSGDGYEDLIIGCRWDGMNMKLNATIFFGSEAGIGNKYVQYIPAPFASSIAIGDFNGDGRNDLALLSDGKIKIFYQDNFGFSAKSMAVLDGLDAFQLEACDLDETGYACLLVRKKNGECSIIKSDSNGFNPDNRQIFISADPDYKEIISSRDTYTQTVDDAPPRVQIITLDASVGNFKKGTKFIFVSHQKKCYLFPYKNKKIRKPLIFNCQNALAVAVGDISNRGYTDLVFACHDNSAGKECSWLYQGNENGWAEKTRFAIATNNACDVVLADFTGNGCLDMVIGQGHTAESFNSKTLIFPATEKGISSKPITIESYNPQRVLVVKNGIGRKSALVILSRHSGSFIGDPDSTVYIGGPDGFKQESKIDFPTFGAVDMVCCDLRDSGYPDLVFSNAAELAPWLDQGSFIYYGTNQGYSRQPDFKLPTKRAHGVVCGDFNHNGYLDLAFNGFDNEKITIFYGSKDGFTAENTVEIIMQYNDKLYKHPRFLSAADLNNDGYLDLIIACIDSDESFVLWGGPNGFSFERKQVFRVRHACNSKVADLNGDGYPELIFGGHTQSESGPHDAFVYIYWGSKDGFREDRRTLIPANAVNSMAVADFNNDGFLDIFVASYQDGRLRDIDSHIYWNQSGQGFLPHKRTPLRTHAVSGNLAADFNEDGWIDLAVANHKVEGNHIAYSTVWYNGTDGFNEKKTINLPTSAPHGLGNVDIGNVLDRSPNEYYVSEPYQMDEKSGIAEIYWKGEIPLKSWVKAQFRFAKNRNELAQAIWQGPTGDNTWFNAHQKIDKAVFSGKFVQYRLMLASFNSLNTPRISEIIVVFDKKEEGI